MLSIDQINQVKYFYLFNFPTIDFKFQNTGTATAFLWQFAIDILSGEVDPTPALVFEADIDDDNALQIMMVNNGWGAAHDLQVHMHEPLLNRLFSDSLRQYRGTIRSGERQNIFCLRQETANSDQLNKEFKKRNTAFGREIHEIELEPIRVRWSCRDDNNAKQEGYEEVSMPFDSFLSLSPEGFFIGRSSCESRMPSSTTYIAIIDSLYYTLYPLLKGPHEQTYPISRTISPGDVERFHIMVGAEMSCHLLLRFKFYVDQTSVIESNEFMVEIWNTRNSRWHDRYRDATEVDRTDLEALRRQSESYRNLAAYRHLSDEEIEDLKYLETQLTNYPFITKSQTS